MDNDSTSIPLPTDWQPTKFPFLSQLESSLYCVVCKEYLKAPVITACSHTFCSLCIRKSLSINQMCPTCWAPEQESRLRKNNLAQEVVDAFLAARGSLMKAALEVDTIGEVPRPLRQQQGEVSTQTSSSQSTARSSRPRRTTRSNAATPVQSQVSNAANEDIWNVPENDGQVLVIEEEKALDDGLVGCPICSTRMKEAKVNAHIDRCLIKSEKDNQPQSRPQSSPSSSQSTRLAPPRNLRSSQKPQSPNPIPTNPAPTYHHPPSPSHTPSHPLKLPTPKPLPERLPKLSYALLKESHLRNKLSDLGIPTLGSKPTLQARHTEWVNLWNANIDSTHPKSKRELLVDLGTWERAQNKPANQPTKEKGWNDDDWKKLHEVDFERLIGEARKKRKVATPVEETTKEGSEGMKGDDQQLEQEKGSLAPAAPRLQLDFTIENNQPSPLPLPLPPQQIYPEDDESNPLYIPPSSQSCASDFPSRSQPQPYSSQSQILPEGRGRFSADAHPPTVPVNNSYYNTNSFGGDGFSNVDEEDSLLRPEKRKFQEVDMGGIPNSQEG